MTTIETALKGNEYPGRGIIVGLDETGALVATYFIMGRSENSRNRVFMPTQDGIKTQAFDPSKMTDPSLIIYHPVRLIDDTLIVTNGDQTDTLAHGLKQGLTARQSLQSRQYEPDEPNYTPRISAVAKTEAPYCYELSILKHIDEGCGRFHYHYDQPTKGMGHMIHTYEQDGNPIPSFHGEPRGIQISGTLEQWSKRVWDCLDSDNRVSLYSVCYKDGQLLEQYMINKNTKIGA